MSAPRCSRLWEAEALEDGRLRDTDRLAFERHLPSCIVCRDELAALTSLRERVSGLRVPKPTPMQRHRARTTILREANRRVLAPARIPRRALVAALLVLSAFGVVFALRARRLGVLGVPSVIGASSSQVASKSAPVFVVDAEMGATWSKRVEGPTTVIALDDGRAAFEVAHLDAAQRFLVALPDGEVEVRGTQFVVDVAGGITRSVAVSSGRVAVRMRSSSEKMVIAGEHWTAPDRAVPASADGGSARATLPLARTPASPSPVSSSKRVAETHATERAGDEFDDAMERFDASDLAEADLRFARFMREFPADARCEDAEFLRAVAHARLGDTKGAASMAARYLNDYPRGFRRIEAQRLVDEAGR